MALAFFVTNFVSGPRYWIFAHNNMEFKEVTQHIGRLCPNLYFRFNTNHVETHFYGFRSDFKYNCATFSRAQGVLRKNLRDDLTVGLLLKQLMFILEANSSHVYFWVR